MVERRKSTRAVGRRRMSTSTFDISEPGPSTLHLDTSRCGSGHHDEALQSINEAINLDRQYVVANPRVFEPVLARHLQNLAFCLIRLGRENEASLPLDEALALCHSLIDSAPLVFSKLRDNCAHMRSCCTPNSQQIEKNVTNDGDKTMYDTSN